MTHAQVSASAALRGLWLLCLLVKGRDGERRFLPIHTMRALPPRISTPDTPLKDGPGSWRVASLAIGVGSNAGLYLRETFATAPAPEVLARCVRHRQANALRAPVRPVRAGELN